jgi:hypothetical protein
MPGVVEQVRQDLGEPVTVADDLGRTAGHVDVHVRREQANSVGLGVRQGRQLHLIVAQVDTGVDAGQFQ